MRTRRQTTRSSHAFSTRLILEAVLARIIYPHEDGSRAVSLAQSPIQIDIPQDVLDGCREVVQNVVAGRIDVDVATAHVFNTSYLQSLLVPQTEADFAVQLRSHLQGFSSLCSWRVFHTGRERCGFGVVAQESIRAGTIIEGLEGVTPEIHNSEEERICELGFQNFFCAVDQADHFGLTLGSLRFVNHSCKPNAETQWDDEGQKMQVVACCEIEKGSPITLWYGPDYFGPGNVQCACDTCVPESAASMRRSDTCFCSSKDEAPSRCINCRWELAMAQVPGAPDPDMHDMETGAGSERTQAVLPGGSTKEALPCDGSLRESAWSSSTEQKLNCRLCSWSCHGESALEKHQRTHTKALGRTKRGQALRNKSQFRNHRRTQTEGGRFGCGKCDKAFTSRENLKTHQWVHTGVKPFRCDECGNLFTTSASLTAHQWRHTGVKPFECDKCNKAFTTKDALRKHQRRHTGVKPFRCDECGNLFTTRASLTAHLRRHTGVKPFECDKCNKAFVDRRDLTRHQWVHTGVKPFRCDECGNLFTTSASLTAHQRRHTGEMPFECVKCDKAFTTKDALKKHQRRHTGVKPFPCDECGNLFTTRGSLTRHQRRHTREMPSHGAGDGNRLLVRRDLLAQCGLVGVTTRWRR